MPSSHAANWFAATWMVFIYFRRSFWFMLPAALLVSSLESTTGLHYPVMFWQEPFWEPVTPRRRFGVLEPFGNGRAENGFQLWWQVFPRLLLLPKSDVE